MSNELKKGELKEGNLKAEDTTWDEVEKRAELLAAADEVASGRREDVETDMEEEADGNPYEVIFDKEYEFDNGDGRKKYPSIDLSGLVDLTTVDGEVLDRILFKLGHAPLNKFKDTTYTKHVAMRVTGLPVEFFNMLSIRDMHKVTAMVYYYFLRG